MNPLNLQVTYSDGTSVDVQVLAIDMIAFESHFDLSITRLEKEMKLTHLFWLAWTSLKRTHATALEFESWVETVALVAEGEAKK